MQRFQTIETLIATIRECGEIKRLEKYNSQLYGEFQKIKDYLERNRCSEKLLRRLDSCYYLLMFAEREIDVAHNYFDDRKIFNQLLDVILSQINTIRTTLPEPNPIFS